MGDRHVSVVRRPAMGRKAARHGGNGILRCLSRKESWYQILRIHSQYSAGMAACSRFVVALV